MKTTENTATVTITSMNQLPLAKYATNDEDVLRLHKVIPLLFNKNKGQIIKQLVKSYLAEFAKVEHYFYTHPDLIMDYAEYLALEEDPWSFDPKNFTLNRNNIDYKNDLRTFKEFKFSHDDVRRTIFEEEDFDLNALAET